jgi:hypothetical protein
MKFSYSIHNKFINSLIGITHGIVDVIVLDDQVNCLLLVESTEHVVRKVNDGGQVAQQCGLVYERALFFFILYFLVHQAVISPYTQRANLPLFCK